jgi:hypothetical protein
MQPMAKSKGAEGSVKSFGGGVFEEPESYRK